MKQVIFRLLGPPEISYNEEQIKIPRRRSRALLYYMVSTHTPQPRERLLTLLCGEMDEESARRTFKTLLAEVRSYLRAIDPNIDWIISDQDQLTFNPLAPIWLDTAIFELDATTFSRSLSQAIKLYRSDFLDGFFLKDAPEFDEWVRSTRDHFRQLYLSALRQMANLYQSDNQVEQAITCMNMLLATDPFSEEAYQLLMRLYWTLGDRTQALRHYERLREVLAETFSVQPSSQTQALYQEIAHSGGPQLVSPVPVTTPTGFSGIAGSIPENPPISTSAFVESIPFIGRESALGWFQKQLLSRPESKQVLLLLQGEAGCGKTRLIQEVQQRFCASWRVLSGSCQEAEGKNPYHMFAEALRGGLQGVELSQLQLPIPWLVQLSRLVPDLFPNRENQQAGFPFDPTVLGDALVALCNHLAQPRHPVLLILEDLQWADEVTLGLVNHLVHAVRRGDVFVLASCRNVDEARIAALCRSVERQEALAMLGLPPFSREEMLDLVTCFLAEPQFFAFLEHRKSGEQLWDHCYERSEGNPFFALEWLTHFKRTSEMNLPVPVTFVPPRVEAFLKAELLLATPEARALLSAGAYLGVSFSLLAAANLAGLDTLATCNVCDELVARKMIAEDPASGDDTYRFMHTLLREVVLGSMGRARRHLLQQRAQTMPSRHFLN